MPQTGSQQRSDATPAMPAPALRCPSLRRRRDRGPRRDRRPDAAWPCDADPARLGQGLQTGGEVWRFADNRLFLSRAFADQIADDHQSGGDPDPRLERNRFDIEATDRVDDTQPRPDRPLGILLMRSRVAEIDQDAVAHVL